MVTIRKATSTDQPVLTAFGRRTFYETFARHNTPEDMAAYLAAAFNAATQAAELADSRRVTLLAELAGRLVGYAQLRFGETPACVTHPAAAELVRLYVDRELQGHGVARRLLDEVEQAAAGHAQAIWLGVWEKNLRAIAFYEKCGFLTVGTHEFRLGRDVQTDQIMLKIIAEQSLGRVPRTQGAR